MIHEVTAAASSDAVYEMKRARANWARLISIAVSQRERYYLGVVRVKDGVASITDGCLVLRTPVAIYPGDRYADGYYELGLDLDLVEAKGNWLSYPDVDLQKPDPRNIPAEVSFLDRQVIQNLITFCQDARALRAPVMIDAQGFHFSPVAMTGYQPQTYSYPLRLAGEELYSPELLAIAFTEMLRYDRVNIWRENHLLPQKTPLVIGVDWNHCALLMPNRSRY